MLYNYLHGFYRITVHFFEKWMNIKRYYTYIILTDYKNLHH